MKKKRMKKIIAKAIAVGLALTFAAVPASAATYNMYVCDIHLCREIVSIAGFDMIPVMDIAGELGVYAGFDGTTLSISDDTDTYYITDGSAEVTSKNGIYYGFDVVPQWINGKFMIQLDFLRDVMGLSVLWDDVTRAMFIGSDNAYSTLVTSPEYTRAKQYLGVSFADRFAGNPIDKAFYDVEHKPGMWKNPYFEAMDSLTKVWIEETDYVYELLASFGAPEGAAKYTWYNETSYKAQQELDSVVAYYHSQGIRSGSGLAESVRRAEAAVYRDACKEAYGILYRYNPGYAYKYDYNRYYKMIDKDVK